MRPSAAVVQKGTLTAHIVASVGWLGAIGAFICLSLVGLSSSEGTGAHAAYPAMQIVGWYVIFPLSLASLLTGVVQSVGTSWGLFRHYWVLFKLLINLLASVLLLVHMQPVDRLASAAAQPMFTLHDLNALKVQVAFDASIAILALLIATALAVYKPRGMTRYGWRKQRALRSSAG